MLRSDTYLHDFTENVFEDLSRIMSADQLEVYCSSNRISGLRIVGNEILETKLVIDSGVGVRVLKEGYTGFASSSELSGKGAREAYHKAARIANSKTGEKESIAFAAPSNANKRNSAGNFLDKGLQQLSERELVELGQRMLNSALTRDSRVYDCSGSVTVVSYDFSVLNSNGVDSSGCGGYAYATLTSMVKDGEQRAQGFDTLVSKKYTSLAGQIEEIGVKATDMSIRSLRPTQPETGRYDMIFTPSCLTSTMRNLALMANGRRVKDGLSMFTESMGKKVASDSVSAVEDGGFEEGMHTCSVDDEGLPTSRTTIIEEGVLKSFIHDSYTAGKFGVRSTGNGLRVWTQVGGSTLEGRRYDFPPTCSSANFMILVGDSSQDEIIQDTKRGILMGWTRYERLLNSKTGVFTANARSGNFLVEKGELKCPVHGFRIYDSYLNLLKSVDRVGNKAEQKGHWGMAAISPCFRTRGAQIISI